MKIGRQEHRSSSISTSNAETIVVRGKDLCGELLGQVSFTDYFWFLLTGSMKIVAFPAGIPPDDHRPILPKAPAEAVVVPPKVERGEAPLGDVGGGGPEPER